MEITAPMVTAASLVALPLANKVRMKSRLGFLAVFVAVILGQLVLWVLRPTGLVVLLPWEYPFLYTAAAWALLSAAKALVTGIVLRHYRALGLWLLVLALLQPMASAINAATTPSPRSALLIVGNVSLKALVADTELRAQCGYYCWPSISALVFTSVPRGYHWVTMIGINKPLLLLVIGNNSVIEARLLLPWKIYRVWIPRGAVIVETIDTGLSVVNGTYAVLRYR